MITDYIGTGRENAVSRPLLRTVTGMKDRTLRNAIEQARHDGAVIINDQSGAGYYVIPDKPEYTKDELDAMLWQYRQNDRRAKSVLHYQKHLKRRLKAAGRL